jgi:hypothetical protein
MAFLNTPLKSLQCVISTVIGTETLPWFNPALFPVRPPNPQPPPVELYYRWRVNMIIARQTQSAYNTREPGIYNGQDVSVGSWVANLTTGQAWQIIKIESKSELLVTAIVQDVYRYNTFRDSSGSGNGTPGTGVYVVFNIGETGLPEIDPVPSSGVSPTFSTNLQSRFQYINLQYDYPLYQFNNTFGVNDVIAASSISNSFVLSDEDNRVVIGRVTSTSDAKPGWFTINPVQKIVDFLDYLPGNIGDIIYSSVDDPGEITTVPGGTELYVKLRNNTSSVSVSNRMGPTTPGNIIQLNGVDVTINAPGDSAELINAINLVQDETGVIAESSLTPTFVQTESALITPLYGEPALSTLTTPAVATINGVSVTFNISSTDAGYEGYARPYQMAQSINEALIPNIIASTPNIRILRIENTDGNEIEIINVSPDFNGISFAGDASGSGLELITPESTIPQNRFTAVDARAINFLDVVGSAVSDFGLISVENGSKACGLYIERGLRSASTTVVLNLSALNSLQPLIGDQAYVIDSDDGEGNNVGEWSLWLFDGVIWIQTSNQNSSTTDAKSLEYTLITTSPGSINIGEISTGRRVTLITVEVTEPFDGTPFLNIGYQINNPSFPPPVPDGLMEAAVIDLTVVGTYTTVTDILFGRDTLQGDVDVIATFGLGASTIGSAQILVSYV